MRPEWFFRHTVFHHLFEFGTIFQTGKIPSGHVKQFILAVTHYFRKFGIYINMVSVFIGNCHAIHQVLDQIAEVLFTSPQRILGSLSLSNLSPQFLVCLCQFGGAFLHAHSQFVVRFLQCILRLAQFKRLRAKFRNSLHCPEERV